MARKQIGKRQRFGIFSRDGYTCGYCGRGPDQTVLEIDHIIPVCQGGTNEDANLRTACMDCNRGKAGKTVPEAIPPEMDRLRLAQELAEARTALATIRQATEAAVELRQMVAEAWCQIRETDSIDQQTLAVMVTYAKKHHVCLVIDWIVTAQNKFGTSASDKTMGRYISGIRRKMIADGEINP